MTEKVPGVFERIKEVLAHIPRGRVATYGQVAALAGTPQGSRTVVWVLKASSEKEGLPWHRVIRKDGSIALTSPEGWQLQKALLESEGVAVSVTGVVSLQDFGWKP